MRPAAPLPDEQERLAVLRSLPAAGSGAEERFARVVRVAAELFDVPVAYVSLVEADHLEYKACVGVPLDPVPRGTTFCAHTVVLGRLLVVPDLAQDERFADSPYVVRDGYRFYAGQPLRVGGHVVGTLCLMDVQPRDLSAQERDRLVDLAALVEGELRAGRAPASDDRLVAALEKRNELLLQFVDTAICGVDPDGYVTFANPAATALLGEEAGGLVGRHFHRTHHHTRLDGSPHPWDQCQSHRALTTGERQPAVPDVVHRRDGRPTEVEYSSAPVVVDGAVVGVVIALADISERRAVERLKDEFVSVVSHELRTPLTSIRGSLGLLASGRFGELPEQGGRLVDIALGNTERLVRLVNDILDLERLEAGRMELQRRPQPLAGVLAAVHDAVAGVAEQAGVTVEVSGGEVVADVDADLLVRALTNLAGNAVKFSPAGGTVRVAATTDGEQVRVAVVDHGRGIPASRLDRVFERFEQVDASDARDKGGTGLGLAITRSIVERHGGAVTVDSVLGEGSTFTVALPALAARAEGEELADVVLVEDDDDLVEVLTAAVRETGARVASARGVDEGVALVRRLRPALVVLDVELSDGRGYEVASLLREDPLLSGTPLLVATVHDLDAEQRRRLTVGPTRFAAKGGAGGDVVASVLAAVREHVPSATGGGA